MSVSVAIYTIRALTAEVLNAAAYFLHPDPAEPCPDTTELLLELVDAAATQTELLRDHTEYLRDIRNVLQLAATGNPPK